MAKKDNANEIRLTRIYNAPVKTVWEAWTDPNQVAQWWGPRGFSLTTHSHNLKTGGTWDYTMHGPDGVDYHNVTQYLEVEPQARLIYDHGGSHDRPPLFRVTVTFTEMKGKTKMEMSMRLDSPEAAAETKKFIKRAGGEATWDRLAEYLEKENSDKDIFVITRTFHTSVETMFEMWTSPEHFAQWLPPTGFTMKFENVEIKEGAGGFYSMTDGKMKMYGRTKYLKIERPNKIVYTQQFCDEHQNTSRHPMVPTWPETMLTTVTLTQEDEDHTRVTVMWEPYGETNREELAAFIKMKGGMTQGWTGSFDKLEDHLEKI
jgi:uncharacterized protein YndB with AHSA1/START domain